MSVLSVRETALKTERLIIRPPERSDFGQWSASRRASRGFLEPWEPRWPDDALTRSDWERRLKAWRASWRADTAYVFLLFTRKRRELQGGVSVTHVRRGPAQSASLGYWLLQPAEGKGYMSEALKAVCNFCFDRLGLARLEAATLPENARSRGVLERCGFREEGLARAYLEIDGRRRDHVLYARLADGASE